MKTNYKIQGTPNSPVLMFSNSLGADFKMWDELIPYLLPYFRVLQYDTRGHGKSELTDGPYTIEMLGKDVIDLLDDLINSMNKAASKAASKTAEVFISAIEKMSIDDAKKILAGDDKAATIYFEVSTSDSLKNLIKPIVQETIQENNVAKYYDKANSFYKNNVKSYVDSSSVMGYAKNFGVDSYLPGSSDESIDDFVTNKAITGLFTMIAQKENEIRNSTTARTTDLLKKVFSK